MMLADIIERTRSCRRFRQAARVERETLKELVGLARLAGSGRNLQPLRYLLVNSAAGAARVFPHLGWAGYFKEWPGPEEGERPSAYIICLLDTRVCREAECDLGIATQNILLGATEKGLGGCRIATFSKQLKAVLNVADYLKILMVLALGKPKEKILVEAMQPGGDVKYWRDANQVHHVPKLALAEILLAGSEED